VYDSPFCKFSFSYVQAYRSRSKICLKYACSRSLVLLMNTLDLMFSLCSHWRIFRTYRFHFCYLLAAPLCSEHNVWHLFAHVHLFCCPCLDICLLDCQRLDGQLCDLSKCDWCTTAGFQLHFKNLNRDLTNQIWKLFVKFLFNSSSANKRFVSVIAVIQSA
jgi:hypothetical protein